jgi:hypothetical protein
LLSKVKAKPDFKNRRLRLLPHTPPVFHAQKQRDCSLQLALVYYVRWAKHGSTSALIFVSAAF